MSFIVFDLELNQDFSSMEIRNAVKPPPFEIIQLGAVKLDSALNIVDSFNSFVKPTIYKRLNPFVVDLTGITAEKLDKEKSFPEVYRDFLRFVGEGDWVFGVWGTSDMKELYRNAELHSLSLKLVSRKYINIQPYVSLYFNYSKKNLLRLEHAVKALNIPGDYPFHDAYNDAYYTAEVFKRIYNSFIQPKVYDPTEAAIRPPRQPKRVIDVEGLLGQFQKMYARDMTEEEKGIILLAYKMGKTNQFLK